MWLVWNNNHVHCHHHVCWRSVHWIELWINIFLSFSLFLIICNPFLFQYNREATYCRYTSNICGLWAPFWDRRSLSPPFYYNLHSLFHLLWVAYADLHHTGHLLCHQCKLCCLTIRPFLMTFGRMGGGEFSNLVLQPCGAKRSLLFKRRTLSCCPNTKKGKSLWLVLLWEQVCRD